MPPENEEISSVIPQGIPDPFANLPLMDEDLKTENTEEEGNDGEKPGVRKPAKGESQDTSEDTDDSSEESDDVDSGDSDTEETEGDEGNEEETAKAPSQPSVKVDVGQRKDGSKVEVPEDTLFEVRVDNEIKKVKLPELLKSYSSDTALFKRHWALKDKEDKVRKDAEGMASFVSTVVDLVEKGDPLSAIAQAAVLQKKDPLEFKRALRNSLLKQLEIYSSLTPEEKRASEANETAAYWKNQHELTNKQREQDVAIAQTRQELLNMASAKNITLEQVREYNDQLTNLIVSGKVPGVDNPKVIDAKMIGEYHDSLSLLGVVRNTLDKVAPSVTDDAEVIGDLIKAVKLYDLTLEQLEEVAKHKYGNVADQAVRNLNQKVTSKKPSSKRQSPREQQEIIDRSIWKNPFDSL